MFHIVIRRKLVYCITSNKTEKGAVQMTMENKAPRPAAGPEGNPLGYAPIGGLILKYAIPAIISMLVTAAYNITDQIFIGNVIGLYGNGATNVAFPLVTLCAALAQITGIGSASNFNINMGAGNKDDAARYVGVGLTMMVTAGVVVAAAVLVFLKPLMIAFGATDNVLPLAVEYTGITAYGIPFLIFSNACSHLIRADGRPTYSMICTITGAAINVFLDYLFMFPFKMGIAGAAYATIIGQIISGAMVLQYMLRFRSVKINRSFLIPKLKFVSGIVKLGTANFINQMIMTVVQITMNNVLTRYGALSVYGGDIPLAVAGIIAKINTIFAALAVGTALGCQPIHGFNTGAKKYDRVKATYKRALIFVLAFSIVAFTCFQLFPRQIVSVFGGGSDLYFEFSERYMRIYMMMICIFGIQPLTVNFFTASGKAKQGIFLSLTRQGLFLLPLLLILPLFFGIDGVLYSGPIADFLAVALCLTLVGFEMRRITALQREQQL